jgi:hypothetical protein
MSARTSKHKIGRTYLYYVCVAGAYHRPSTYPTLKHHKEDVAAQVRKAVSGYSKTPSACALAWTT